VTLAQTHREVERKLRVHAFFKLPHLAEIPTVTQVDDTPAFTMQATYFDTDELTLFRWGITLRRREGGTDAGWHLKLPVAGADGSTRDEVRLPLTPADHVPAPLVDIVSPLLLGKSLGPVVTLETQRHPYVMVSADGGTVELVDDTVSIREDGNVVAVFREIEVEADEADHDPSLALMEAIVAGLEEAGAVPGTASKAASALGPRASAPPDVAVPPLPGAQGLAADALRTMICTHVRSLLLADVAVRRGLPDSVHQMRVAARRLRSVLRTFDPLFAPTWSHPLQVELKWLATELGAIRDSEVLQERLDAHAQLLPTEERDLAIPAINAFLARRQEGAKSSALAALRSDRHDFLLEDLVEGSHSPRFTDEAFQSCAEAFPPLVLIAWKRLRKGVRGLEVTGPSAQWHAARIKAKRARYAVEAVAPLFGAPMQRLARRLADTTDVLGSHQDAAVAQDLLREIAGTCDGMTAFALGVLHEREFEFEMDDRELFTTQWPRTVRAAKTSGLMPS
jgi:CHAD domain-containing protein